MGKIPLHCQRIFLNKSNEVKAPVFCFKQDYSISIANSPTNDQKIFKYKSHDINISLPLSGAFPNYRLDNFSLAIRVSSFLIKPLNPILVQQALHRQWPGRNHPLTIQGKNCLLDVAHNPQGIELFCQYLKDNNLKPHFLISFLSDKDFPTMIDTLASMNRPLYFFSTQTDRSWQKSDVPKDCSKIPFFDNWRQAFDQVKSNCQPNETIVFTGSCYAVGNILQDIGFET